MSQEARMVTPKEPAITTYRLTLEVKQGYTGGEGSTNSVRAWSGTLLEDEEPREVLAELLTALCNELDVQPLNSAELGVSS